MLGLYIHIPFCHHVCGYCDFYKMVAHDELKLKVINAMIKEMELKNINKYHFDTIYIGGGTPSCLSIDLLKLLLDKISSMVNLSSLKEFTIEANSEDLTDEFLSLITSYYVTRLSIGIQSFNKHKLQILTRTPYIGFSKMKTLIKKINDYKINNFNLDLIYATPNEKLSTFKSDLKKIIKLNPNHISTYALIIEPHTILDYQISKKLYHPLNEVTDEKMYNYLKKQLIKHHYQHYETSNFAKENFQAIHNLIYWHNEEYIGIGPSASSNIDNYRKTNIKNLNQYLSGINNNEPIYEDVYLLTDEIKKTETIMLGLRLIKGINEIDFYNKYHQELETAFPEITKLVKQGLLIKNEHYISIPEQYSYIANFIIGKII